MDVLVIICPAAFAPFWLKLMATIVWARLPDKIALKKNRIYWRDNGKNAFTILKLSGSMVYSRTNEYNSSEKGLGAFSHIGKTTMYLSILLINYSSNRLSS